jgi:uncharacterized protein YunC (DUF1805 family)
LTCVAHIVAELRYYADAQQAMKTDLAPIALLKDSSASDMACGAFAVAAAAAAGLLVGAVLGVATLPAML